MATQYTNVIPMASPAACHIMHDRFTESGAGTFNLDADPESASCLMHSLGVRFTKDYAVQTDTLTAELRVCWDHRLSKGLFALTASFTGYPETSFTNRGEMPNRDNLGLGLGLTWKVKDNIGHLIAHDGNFSANNTRNDAMLSLQHRWQLACSQYCLRPPDLIAEVPSTSQGGCGSGYSKNLPHILLRGILRCLGRTVRGLSSVIKHPFQDPDFMIDIARGAGR